MDPNHIRLAFTGTMVTTHCNLNCKLCITGAPILSAEGKNFPFDLLIKTFDKYFQLVEHVDKFSLGGGEPLLQPRLGELVEHFMQYQNQFDELEIITNGTLIPPQSLLHVLTEHRDKITVLVDKYGELSPVADKVGDLLTERGIRNKVRIYYGENCHCGGWVDLTDFSLKHPNKEDQISLFQRCAYPRAIVRNGVCINDGLVLPCAHASLAQYKKLIPPEPPYYVNLLDPTKSIHDLQQEIVNQLNIEYHPACAYCNGMCEDSERFMPAEQMPGSGK